MRLRWILTAALIFAATGIVRADHPQPPVNLFQNFYEGQSLPTGGSTKGSSRPLTVILGASSDEGSCATDCEYTLGVEIRPVSEPFQDYPTHYVSMPEKEFCDEIPYPQLNVTGLLPNTAYKWQCIEYTCSCPPPFEETKSGVSCDLDLAGGQGGGQQWVQFNGGGTAFVTGGPFVPKFVMAYVAATDQGRGQVFFFDKNPSIFAQSWKIETRRTDFTTVFLNTFYLNKPGGPPPGDVTGFTVFDLPRVDLGNFNSFEVDVMYRVIVYSGVNGTGTELYRSAFYFAQHPSSSPLAPFNGFAGPTTSGGPQPAPFIDIRPTAQTLALGYSLFQKLTSGPQTVLSVSSHGIVGAFPTKQVHAPKIITPNVNLNSGDSIFFIRSRRIYHWNNGPAIGNFDVSPKSASSGFNIP